MDSSLIGALGYIIGFRAGCFEHLLRKGVTKENRLETVFDLMKDHRSIDRNIEILFSPDHTLDSLTIDSSDGRLTMELKVIMPNGEVFEVYDFLKKNLEFYTHGLSDGKRKEILNDLNREYLIQATDEWDYCQDEQKVNLLH